MAQKLKYIGATHVGKIRDHNEDYFITDPENNIFIIADGVGGHQAGEVASKTAAELIHQDLIKNKDFFSKEILQEKAILINEQILIKANTSDDYKGMATTLVILWGNNGKYLLCNVGDSRAYLFRNNVLKQISKDHSVVQAMIDMGEITKKQARTHHLKHYVTQVIGSEKIKPDIFEPALKKDDLILLCTDGLTDMVTDEQICNILKTETTPDKISKALTEAALNYGGVDNITHILIKI